MPEEHDAKKLLEKVVNVDGPQLLLKVLVVLKDQNYLTGYFVAKSLLTFLEDEIKDLDDQYLKFIEDAAKEIYIESTKKEKK